MKQLRFLNFYKLISNIATNLVGAFIPILILQATGSIVWASLSIVIKYLVRMGFNFAFKKIQGKYPQLMLVCRLISVLAYSTFIILIDVNLWVGIIGTIIFIGLDECLKTLPVEIIYSYSSTEEDGKNSLGITRLVEQVGVLIAQVVGGVMLDVNKTLIVVISMVLYVISVIPLLIYYIQNRNQKTFNQDAVSNAQIAYEKHPELQSNAMKYTRKILIGYAIVYFIYCFQDVFGTAFNIHVFLTNGSFGMVGYILASYNAMYGLGCYIFGIIDAKKDTTILVIASCLVCAGAITAVALIENIVLWFVLVAVCGFFYGFICTFMLQRLLPKCKILGVGNKGLYYREFASNMSVVVTAVIGVCGSMVPVLMVVAIAMLVSSNIIPINEEISRRTLIKYLQTHEQVMSENLPKIEQDEIIEVAVINKRKRSKK